MPRIQVKTPGAVPPVGRPRANPADEDLDPTDADDRDEPKGLMNRATDFVSGRYANRKARKRLAPPRNMAGRRG